MRSCTASRWMALPALVALALAVPATAVAKRADAGKAAAPLRSVSAPPEEALAGGSFTLSARIANEAQRSTRPRLVVRLRKHKYASGGRVLIAKRLGRIAAGESRRFAVELELPESVLGRYWLSVCVRVRAGGECERSGHRINIVRPAPPAGSESPQPSEAAAPPPRYDVLAFTEAAGETHASSADGIDALRDVGSRNRFRVDGREQLGRCLHREQPQALPRGGVPQHGRRRPQRRRSRPPSRTTSRTAAASSASTPRSSPSRTGSSSPTCSAPAPTGPAAALGRRDDQGRRPRPRRQQVAARVLAARRTSYYNFTEQRARVLARARHGRRDHLQRRHDGLPTTRSPGARTTRAAARSTRRSAHGRRLLPTRQLPRAPGRRGRVDGRRRPTRSTATAGPPCWPTTSRSRSRRRRTSTSRSASTSCRTAASSRPPATAACACTTRRRRLVGRHRARSRSTPTARTGSTARPWTTTSRPTSGCICTTRRSGSRASRSSAASRTRRRRRPATPRPPAADLATLGPVDGLLPALALQVRRQAGDVAAHLNLASEQKIMKVEVNRGACCHVAGDIDFDRTTTSGSSPATTRRPAAATRGGFPPFNDHEDQ